jgi:hypothetical protein
LQRGVGEASGAEVGVEKKKVAGLGKRGVAPTQHAVFEKIPEEDAT